MNLLDRGAAWLLDRSRAAAGTTATYIRGASRTSITIVRTARSETVDDGSGVPIAVRRFSLVVRSSDLSSEPRPGDRIEESIGSETVTWEVLPPSDGEPCFRWWDRAQSAYVVFVSQIGSH